MINRTVTHIFLLFLITGAPGAIKLISIFIIEKIAGTEELGIILSDFSIVNLLAYFTAIGFSSILLARSSSSLNVHELFGIMVGFLYASLPFLACGFLVIFFLYEIGILTYSLSAALFLSGFTVYQFIRHGFMGQQSYGKIATIEIVIFCSTILTGAYVYKVGNNFPLVLWLPLVFVSVVWVLYWLVVSINNSRKFLIHQKNIVKNSSYFGMANFLSGGMYLLIVPIAMKYESSYYAALIGVLVNLTAISMLVSRALTNLYLPKIARAKSENSYEEVVDLLVIFRRLVFFAAFVLAGLLLIIISIYGEKYYPQMFGLDGAIVLVWAVIISVSIGQLFLPENSWIVVEEQGKYSFLLNLYCFIVFCATVIGLYGLEISGVQKLQVIALMLVFIQFAKGMLLRRFVKNSNQKLLGV